MTQSDNVLQAIAYCVLFAVALIVMELAVRKGYLIPDISRRLSHIASGLFAIFMYQQFSSMIFLSCNVLLLLFITASYSRKALSSIHKVERKTYGELFLPLGILLTFLITWEHPVEFTAAILTVTLADAAAGIVADLRQKRRASRAGSAAFFIIAMVILGCVTKESPQSVLSIAFITTAVEKASPLGSDNLTIPIVMAILLLL